mmetsp:Transcript_122458/g.391553  ORF Transcript_122458/g.391553 Transcript_122458/m.391553 type:complete len:90 (+) Transcript_122458:1226-1495(+)
MPSLSRKPSVQKYSMHLSTRSVAFIDIKQEIDVQPVETMHLRPRVEADFEVGTRNIALCMPGLWAMARWNKPLAIGDWYNTLTERPPAD